MTKLLVIFFALAIMINATNAIGEDENVENDQQLVQDHNEAYNNGTTPFRMNFIPDARKVFLHPLIKFASLPRKLTNFMVDTIYDRDVKKFVVRRGEETAPESVDLRDRGDVTSVKNQGKCGSCWAFGVTGLLEAYYKNKTGQLVELSQQYLVDCSSYPLPLRLKMEKCSGNFPPRGLRFVRENGMVRDADYPYIGIGGRCNKSKRPTEFHKFNEIMSIKYDERAMKEAIHRYGPLIVAIGTTTPLAYYREGIYFEQIPGQHPPHAVLIVGYGTDPQYGPYWIVKNSWGTAWGEAGYIRVTRDQRWDGGISKIAYFIR